MSIFGPSFLRSAGWFFVPIVAVGAMVLMAGPAEPKLVTTEVSEQVDLLGTDAFDSLAERSTSKGVDEEAVRSEQGRLRELELVSSPFASKDRYEREPEVGVERVDPTREAPDFRLTSVMSGVSGTVCVINKQVRRVGDLVEDGWSVKEIDAAHRRVVLVDTQGNEMVLTQH